MAQKMATSDTDSARDRDSYDLGELAEYVLKGCHEGIAILDRDMCYIMVNDQYLSDFRVAEKELAGKCHYDVFPEIPPRWKAIHRRVLAGKTESTGEDRFVRADGSLDYLWWECRPWYDETGKVGGMIIYSSVITHRKLLEDELRRSRDELEARVRERTFQLRKANEELEASIRERQKWEKEIGEAKMQAELYLDLMGHDISNMHQIILGQLEIVREILERTGKGKGEEGEKELIDASISTLQRSARLIENVRNLQKLKAGLYQPKSVDLGKVIMEAVSLYMELPNRDVRISYTPVRGCYVMANPLLKEVFANLLDNAVKHCEDPVMIRVEVKPVCADERLFYQVAVEDNGHGIPDDRKATIFERLKRAGTKAGGAGLGLYIVKTLVEGFGGFVAVEDRVKGDHTKGARFVVTLPAEQAGKTDCPANAIQP